MELYLKKYFWLVHVLVLSLCALLLARGVNHVIEAKYLIGTASGAQATKAGPGRLHKPAAMTAQVMPPSKDAQVVIDRNIFCSTCEPPVPLASGPALPGDPNNPPATSLPLVLMATSVARDEALSSATIANTQSNKSGSYWLNEDIPGAGTIVKIQPRFVDFKNRSANRVERLDLSGSAPHPPPAVPAPVAAASPAAGAPDDFMASVDKGVRKIDESHYEIDRSLVDKVLGDPNLVARAARIVPSIKDGKSNGFKMYAIRPNSVYAKIGFQNGDTIHSINGFEMTSPDKALEVYTKVKSASSLSIQMTRRGQPLTMEYGIK